MTIRPERLIVKLGSRCNLDCPHCHQAQRNYEEHPRLLEWIRQMDFKRITFSGGEPTMYWNVLKKYIEALDDGNRLFRLPTNGTLLTDEMVDFFNAHGVYVFVSYDGECGGRDTDVPIRWQNAARLENGGLCGVFSTPQFSIKNYGRDLERLKEKYKIRWIRPDEQRVNWIHQTADNPNPKFGKREADSFIRQYIDRLEAMLYLWKTGLSSKKRIQNYLRSYYRETPYSEADHGVQCCGSRLVGVTLDGRILLCPYGTKAVGTIDEFPSDSVLDSMIPKKCLECEIFNFCHCSCVASVSDLDCYVIKTLRPKIEKLLQGFTFSTD